jgi:hypothetical protein
LTTSIDTARGQDPVILVASHCKCGCKYIDNLVASCRTGPLTEVVNFCERIVFFHFAKDIFRKMNQLLITKITV